MNTTRKRYITPAELQETRGIPKGTSANWRSARIGPPYIKLSATKVLYDVEAVDKWFADHTVQTLESV